MKVADVRFVLVGAQTAGNVGSAARAIKNMGFRRLVLVGPQCDPSDAEARRLAVDASDLLDDAEVCDELDRALTGATMTVGTTARTGKQRHPHWRVDELADEMLRHADAHSLAVVFGREDSGLTDEELDRCSHLIYLPSSRDYRSINLAQAVMLVAYELRRGRLSARLDPLPQPAEHQEREAMFDHLEESLREIGFLKDDPAESIMRRLRRVLGRRDLSAAEVKLFRGIARQTLWAARRGRGDR